MGPSLRLAPAATGALFCLTSLAAAAGAQFWEVATLADFLKGDVSNLSIDEHGRVALGPSLTEVADASLPHLWSGFVADDGSLLVGSGNQGQVLRIDGAGQRSVRFDSNELEAHAVAAGPDGSLYVGTSPDGRVYRVAEDGAAEPFFDPDDKYIWALAVDPSGAVYVATGDKGRIYRVTADGSGEEFYDTKATNVRTLALAADGTILAGTESPGRVFRINAEKRGFLLLDSGLPEISALRVAEGGIVYAAAVSSKPQAPEPATPTAEPVRQPVPTVSTEITAISIADVTASTASSSGAGGRESGRTSGRGAVFRIQPDGVWDQIWGSGEDAPYDLVPESDTSLLIATGSSGKVFRVAGEPSTTTLVTRVPAQQITATFRESTGSLLLVTANPGKIFRLATSAATRGTYDSDVLDSESVSTWGTLSWKAQVPRGARVSLRSRSGNTAAPDQTWSPWSDPYTESHGSQIVSPKARYLQWQLELQQGKAESSPVVTSVSVAYLQRNQRPEITSITVHPPGVVFQKPFSTGEAEIAGYQADPLDRRPSGFVAGAASAATSAQQNPVLGRRGYQQGLQTFLWRAQDANDDELTYTLFYRREGETTWKPLKQDLTEPLFVWDTSSVPNGTYVVKLTASDSLSNPPGTALAAERESSAFDVDNTPPTVTVSSFLREDGRTRVRFVVTDDSSAVERVEYSLDANRWRSIYPVDGIADSPREEFELSLEVDTVGKAIILRATDLMNNVATTRAEEPAPR
jgi:sugar lactone lactonase YvrE